MDLTYFFISGEYMGETLDDNYLNNFANSFNSLMLRGKLSENNIKVTFEITNIIHSNLNCLNVGDKFEFEIISKHEYSKDQIYYQIYSDVHNGNIDLSNNFSVLCSENLYNKLHCEVKFSELKELLDKLTLSTLEEKEYFNDLISTFVNRNKN